MSDVQASAAQAPVDAQPDVALAAPVTIEVPAAHTSLFQRIKALIERDEQWIIDNIHAGITHFESIVGGVRDEVEAIAIEVKNEVEDAKDDLTPTID